MNAGPRRLVLIATFWVSLRDEVIDPLVTAEQVGRLCLSVWEIGGEIRKHRDESRLATAYSVFAPEGTEVVVAE